MAGRESGQSRSEKNLSMVSGALEPAATRTTRRQFRIALSRQRCGLIDRFGRHAHEAFEFVAVAFGAIDLFTIEDQGLEGVIALTAFEFVHRHFRFLYSTSKIQVFFRLYTSLARRRICRSLSVKLA